MSDADPAAPAGATAGCDDWASGWEAHRRRQLASFLAATPAQRLAWLEEMIELAHRTGALPRPRTAETGERTPRK
ncbi:MAG: hypothetical protein QME96_02990 [Myxococcota bacterium]|nr:hypothetical protein [Myxococcota bacterium]